MVKATNKFLNETPSKRKCAYVIINNIKIKLQLDTGSDITIINDKTWKKQGKLKLLTLIKVICGVSGRKLNFLGEFVCNICFAVKTKKAVVLVLKNTMNLFGMVVLPYSNFGTCQSIHSVTK